MAINEEKKKVTIYSVAHEAGVSLATVSRVINDSSLVKEDTRKKVEDAIVKLGYKPNAVAQGLALKKTTTIALVVPDSSFLYIGKIINGLLDVAKIYKYNITLHTTSSSINEMGDIIDNIIKSRADGIIIYNEAISPRQLDTLASFEIPMVFIGQKVEADNACNVYIDYNKAIKEIVTKYIAKGVYDIAYVEDRKNPILNNLVTFELNEAFKKIGKEFNNYIQIPNNYHNSYEYLREYFVNRKHELILTLRDSQSVAVVNACQENGISIPNETELICVMDSRYNDMTRPTISSFDIPSYDLGALAMRVMTKMLTSADLSQKNYKLNYVFNKRTSTKI